MIDKKISASFLKSSKLKIIFGVNLVLLVGLCLMGFRAFSQDEMIPVVVDGDEINYLQEEGRIKAKGNVKLKYKGVELFCDEVDYNANTNIAQVIGPVKIVKDGGILEGRDVTFNFANFDAEIGNIKIVDPPIYGVSEKGTRLEDNKYVLNSGYVTTCDLDEPHYRMTAKSVTIYPGDRIVAKNVFLKVGKIPILYIPLFSQSLKDDTHPFDIVPGKDKEWGYYVLSSWRYNLNSENRGKVHIDWYEKRGTGLGITHKMETKKFGEALIKYYRLEDNLYNLQDREELFDQYPEKRNIAPKYLEDDRYKAQFSYSWDPNPNVSIKSETHKFSDPYFMKEFFEREYDKEPYPLSYTLVNYSMDHSSISLLGQKRMNNFWGAVEYLPQVEYDFYNQRLGGSNFYFSSKDRVGYLNLLQPYSGEDSSFRFHSENTLSYNSRLGWLQINPYVGAETAYYSKRPDADIDEDLWRVTPQAGAILSTKLYKFINAEFNLLGEQVDQMRHVITPEISYNYQHKPTAPNSSVFQFDSHDSVSRGESVVFELKNKLQAKNEERTWDLVYFSPSVTYQIHEEGRGSHFTTLDADLEVYPVKGISFNADSQYDLDNQYFSEVNADIGFHKYVTEIIDGEEVEKEQFFVALGHRYDRKGNSQGTLDFTCQLTEKVALKSYILYEYTTDDFEKQQYAIRTDLHCWWMDVGLDLDRHSRGGKDLTFWLAFTLKDFPDLSFDFTKSYKGAKPAY